MMFELSRYTATARKEYITITLWMVDGNLNAKGLMCMGTSPIGCQIQSCRSAHPDRQSLHYWGVNQTSKKWAQIDTWGDKLVENITQAVARDCLAETLYKLDREHHMTAVFTIHDEVIVEVNGEDDLNTILDVMAAPIEWAPGLPLKGAGFVCDYYQKD